MAEDFGGLLDGEGVGIENQVVGERIVDVGVEVGLEVATAGGVLLLDVIVGGGEIELAEVGDALGAFPGGADQAQVEGGGEAGEDEMGTASDEDAIPELGEAEGGLGDLLVEGGGGGVKAEEFLHGIPDVGDAVLGHVTDEGGGEIMFGESFLDEASVEDGPRGTVAGAMLLEEPGEVFGDGDATGAGHAGEGDRGRGSRVLVAFPGGDLGLDVTQRVFE